MQQIAKKCLERETKVFRERERDEVVICISLSRKNPQPRSKLVASASSLGYARVRKEYFSEDVLRILDGKEAKERKQIRSKKLLNFCLFFFFFSLIQSFWISPIFVVGFPFWVFGEIKDIPKVGFWRYIFCKED